MGAAPQGCCGREGAASRQRAGRPEDAANEPGSDEEDEGQTATPGPPAPEPDHAAGPQDGGAWLAALLEALREVDSRGEVW